MDHKKKKFSFAFTSTHNSLKRVYDDYLDQIKHRSSVNNLGTPRRGGDLIRKIIVMINTYSTQKLTTRILNRMKQKRQTFKFSAKATSKNEI